MKRGDELFWVYGPETGYLGARHTVYQLAKVIKKTEHRVQIEYRFRGSEALTRVFVKPRNLFSPSKIPTKRVQGCNDFGAFQIDAIVGSARAARGRDGSYILIVADVKDGTETVLETFTGPGKMKKARQRANDINTKR